jgi:hypothetical protein
VPNIILSTNNLNLEKQALTRAHNHEPWHQPREKEHLDVLIDKYLSFHMLSYNNSQSKLKLNGII